MKEGIESLKLFTLSWKCKSIIKKCVYISNGIPVMTTNLLLKNISLLI